MPPRFEGKFGIPPSHSVESELTRALYRLPESVSLAKVDHITEDLVGRVNEALKRNEAAEPLSPSEVLTLQLKLTRHFEDNGDAVPINIPTCVDALIESPKFLQSDKGSIQKLFELHEMKTLQKIAELRRKRSERTGDSGPNPYEALFEAPSGKYYLARLLNMPHLEAESEYMAHCVGTSRSYINKIKRGEVEIFSLRSTADHTPVVTIEFDPKVGRLLQVKTKDDGAPIHEDAFFPDLVSSVEMLQGTLDDENKPRKVSTEEVEYYRKVDILRQRTESGEQFSIDELKSLYGIDAKSVGFEGAKDARLAGIRRGRDRQKDIETMCDCPPEFIATDIQDIAETTQVFCADKGDKISSVDFREEKNQAKLLQIIEFNKAFKETGSPARLDVAIEGGIVPIELTSETLESLRTYETAIKAYENTDGGSPSWVWEELKDIQWTPPNHTSLAIHILDHGSTTPVERDQLVLDMDKVGYRVLTFSELVALGIIKPELNKRDEMLNTHEKHTLRGDSQVPYLYWNGDKRNLNALHTDGDWSERRRFLFVRK